MNQLMNLRSKLFKQYHKFDDQVSNLPEKEKILRAIERNQQIKEALYLFLLQKREEAEVSYAITEPSIKVVEYAISNNKPMSPKANVIYLSTILLGLISAQFIAALYSVFIVRRYVATKKWIMDKYLFFNSLKGGIKLAIGIFSALLGQQIGIFILNYYMDSQEVGWYAISLSLTTMFLLISSSIRTVLQSWIGSADESIIEISEQTVVITRHVFLIFILIRLIFALFG